MAQLSESVAIVKVSRLLKDGESVKTLLDEDMVAQLEAVIQELVSDDKALVEVILDE